MARRFFVSGGRLGPAGCVAERSAGPAATLHGALLDFAARGMHAHTCPSTSHTNTPPVPTADR